MTPYQRIFGSGPTLLLLAIALSVGAIELQKVTGLPQPEMSLPIRLELTGLILVLGGAVIIWSMRALPLQQRGRVLVAAGPYRCVRHPIYAALFFSTGLAVFFIAQTILALAALALMLLGGHIFVRREEKLMEQQFGQEWRDYARRTPRFFPRLIRRSSLVARR